MASDTRSSATFILLHPNDNVLVCVQETKAGQLVDIGGVQYRFDANIQVGHKIARHDLNAGEKILRYGVPIGTLTQKADRGAHIHMHNLESDYIPSHHRDAEQIGERK